MKKLSLLLLPILLLAACQTQAPVEVEESIESPEILTYSSETLHLTFDYPSISFGRRTAITEEDNTVTLWTEEENGELRKLTKIRVIEIKPQEAFHSFEEYLNATLLPDSESCSIELSDEEEDMVRFSFNSSVSFFENDFDENCEIYTKIQYYKDQPAFFALVGGGQAPAFEAVHNKLFYESIKLF